MLKNKRILITGGTGSFGRAFTKKILMDCEPEKLIILSRDELKQYEMAQEFPSGKFPINYFIGDVTDRDRMYRAFDGVDYVIHAAAMKQVPASERNPFEAVKTNILGAQNIIDAAIDRGVKKVVALSTDKAVNPVNLYGATKLCSEKLFIAGNSYSGRRKTKFSVVRYGNVMGSRGSVIPLFLARRGEKLLPITDERMTRFWITLTGGVELVLSTIGLMNGGELFIPKIPSMSVTDLARAISPDCEFRIVGIRPGEKIHEILISESESGNTLEFEKFFVILPDFLWQSRDEEFLSRGKPVSEGFVYSSDSNQDWLTRESMQKQLISEGWITQHTK